MNQNPKANSLRTMLKTTTPFSAVQFSVIIIAGTVSASWLSRWIVTLLLPLAWVQQFKITAAFLEISGQRVLWFALMLTLALVLTIPAFYALTLWKERHKH